MAKSFYDVLGVDADASTDEITAAYRERIKETHPDVSDEEDAAERTQKVIEAKEVLTDEDERSEYDQLGHDAYVRDNVDADWADVVDDHGMAGSADDSQRTEPGPGSGAESVYEGTWADTGTATGDTSTDDTSDGTTTDSTDDDARADDSASATGTASASTDSGTTAASSDARSGHRRSARDLTEEQKRERSTATNVGETVGWAAGIDGRHAVRNGTRRERIRRTSLYPPSRSMVLLVAAFVSYPSLIFSTFFSPFPLAVKLTVGMCTLFLVAYLMSIPDTGVYIFGSWSVLTTLSVVAFGIPLLSAILLLGVTYIPLLFTLLIYYVLRW